jgi:hypothetical protein
MYTIHKQRSSSPLPSSRLVTNGPTIRPFDLNGRVFSVPIPPKSRNVKKCTRTQKDARNHEDLIGEAQDATPDPFSRQIRGAMTAREMRASEPLDSEDGFEDWRAGTDGHGMDRLKGGRSQNATHCDGSQTWRETPSSARVSEDPYMQHVIDRVRGVVSRQIDPDFDLYECQRPNLGEGVPLDILQGVVALKRATAVVLPLITPNAQLRKQRVKSMQNKQRHEGTLNTDTLQARGADMERPFGPGGDFHARNNGSRAKITVQRETPPGYDYFDQHNGWRDEAKWSASAHAEHAKIVPTARGFWSAIGVRMPLS